MRSQIPQFECQFVYAYLPVFSEICLHRIRTLLFERIPQLFFAVKIGPAIPEILVLEIYAPRAMVPNSSDMSCLL